MTYREILNLYKEKKLDDVQAVQVEAEIEKQEAISEYLFDREEDARSGLPQGIVFGDRETSGDASETEFLKAVNRSIRKAFLKLGMTVGAVTLAIMLFVVFALPKMVSTFYYNPGKKIVGKFDGENNQMSMDMKIYTELAIPGYPRSDVTVDSNGYGNYDICIKQNFSYNGIFTNLEGKVEKGKLKLYDTNVLQPPVGNAFAWFQMKGNNADSLTELVKNGQGTSCVAGYPREAAEELNNLNDKTMYLAYVTLDRMMKYEDFVRFIDGDKENISDLWCAICTNNRARSLTKYTINNLGFRYGLTSSFSLEWNRKAYPNLILWDEKVVEENSEAELGKKMRKEKFMKTHFISMLRYMKDQKRFLKMMGMNRDGLIDAARYVEENGLVIYGFSGVAQKDTLLKLNELDEVYEIYTQPLK